MNKQTNKQITIVTAFFDIGRGNIPRDKGYPEYLIRTTDTYFEYFSNLAKLENEMIVFTSPDLKERVEKLREGKPTQVITFDLNKKFKHILNKIKEIQELDSFKSKISPKQIKNIEYWSNHYVLVNNLKTFLVNLSIRKYINNDNLVAWVDFGYIRNPEMLNNIKEWYYSFEEDKIHLFSIKKINKIKTMEDVYTAIFNNNPYIIGGSIVGSRHSWNKFNKIVFNCQRDFIRNNIIDDDQGVYLTSYFKNKEFVNVNYLGKDNWFGLFKKFDLNNKPQKLGIFQKIIEMFYER